MPKSFSIDFIRQAFEQKLLEEHNKNKEYFGGKNQVNIFSFYEQLKSQEQVDRFVETYRDLSEQQNRAGLILNGVIVAPENPTITNLYSCDIIPMSWTCSFRCTLANRDQACETIDNLIKQLKGRKVDIAELCCRDNENHKVYTPFMVGTIGQNFGQAELKNYDFIKAPTYAELTNIRNLGIIIDYNKVKYLYCEQNNQLKVCEIEGSDSHLPYTGFNTETAQLDGNRKIIVDGGASWQIPTGRVYKATGKLTIIDEINEEYVDLDLESQDFEITYDSNNSIIAVNFHLEKDIQDYVEEYSGFALSEVYLHETQVNVIENDGSFGDVIFPPEHESFEKYKLSFSFDAIRCDEPRNLNAEEYCEISFSGSATLVNESVQLGNDLIKISAKKLGINAKTPIDFTTNPNNPTWWLEPLEMPSGNEANTNPVQLASNLFKTNSHTDAIALALQYTFIYDKSVPLLKQLFYYGRYGQQGLTVNDISPNMIFEIKEIWSSWGDYEENSFKAKIVESIDIENTESDTLTLSLTMQIQGDNN